MVKKAMATKKKSVVKSKISKSKIHKLPITQTSNEIKVEKILVENFVSLQKVMTNLSVKFDNLTNQISKLLELFEISAKALAEKEFDLGKGDKDNKKIIEKIDNLAEQNKIIAKGLTLLHEPGFGQAPPVPVQRPIQIQKPIQPPMLKPEQSSGQAINIEEYQKSISSASADSKPSKFKPLPKN